MFQMGGRYIRRIRMLWLLLGMLLCMLLLLLPGRRLCDWRGGNLRNGMNAPCGSRGGTAGVAQDLYSVTGRRGTASRSYQTGRFCTLHAVACSSQR